MLEFFGRCHPLILHLPIGFFAIAFLMEITKRQELKPAIDFTLKWGMYAAVITAASGFLLSREGGYEEELLFWHQWSGIGTALLSVLLFYFHKTGSKAYFPCFVVTIVFLLLTGHHGGSLTHGSDFLTAPFQKKKTSPVISNLDSAAVFHDLIQPILNEKCAGCHNESKLKGDLLLTNKKGILAGGKSGAILAAGDLSNSPMVQQIHLPIEEKKHMPPEGKKQLTKEEIQLLEWWVEQGADFEKTVAQTETPDSIRAILKKKVQAPKDAGVFALDVPPASESRLKKLREIHFKIRPIAQGSPFLEARFMEKNKLDKAALKKLKSISKQLTSLDLSNSLVDDNLLVPIRNLPHLQKLFLQNTLLTDEGLLFLKDLKYLEYLNLYGTKISDQGLENLAGLQRLKKLYLWQTNVSETGMAALKTKLPRLYIDHGIDPDLFGDARLSPPLISAGKDIFKDSIQVELQINLSGANIFYTLDGSEPDSLSKKYEDPILLRQSAELKAFAHKSGWLSSQPVSRFFAMCKYEIAKVKLSPQPNDQYKGKGPSTLTDLKKGSVNFKDGEWLGFEKSHATVNLDLGQVVEISRVTVGALESTASYIFFPKGMEISVSENGRNFKKVLSKTYPTATAPEAPELASFSEGFSPTPARFVKVKVKSNLFNPDWHPAPGAACWVFLDEILVE